jgi:diacylglycerol O-acyltransferase / wax synthase
VLDHVAPLDPEDRARLRMSTPQNPMVVTAVLELGPPAFGLEELRAIVERRASALPKLRSSILGTSTPRWRLDAVVCAEAHLARAEAPPDEDLAGLVSTLAAEPFEAGRPPWRLWLLDRGSRGSVVVARVHHALMDGVALLGALFALSDEGEGWVPPGDLLHPAGDVEGTRSTAGRAMEVLRLVARRPDDRGALAGRLTGEKRFAWTEPLALPKVRAAAHVVGAHVNDVFVAAVAGALEATGASRGRLHALVPVALPREGLTGNRYASLFVELPTHAEGPLERVVLAQHAMKRARGGGVGLGRTLVGAASVLGATAERVGVGLLSRKASVVASNLAGSPVVLNVGGRRVGSILFASPAPGSVPLSVSALGYAGALQITVASDASVAGGPEPIARRCEAELRAVIAAAGV